MAHFILVLLALALCGAAEAFRILPEVQREASSVGGRRMRSVPVALDGGYGDEDDSRRRALLTTPDTVGGSYGGDDEGDLSRRRALLFHSEDGAHADVGGLNGARRALLTAFEDAELLLVGESHARAHTARALLTETYGGYGDEEVPEGRKLLTSGFYGDMA